MHKGASHLCKKVSHSFRHQFDQNEPRFIAQKTIIVIKSDQNFNIKPKARIKPYDLLAMVLFKQFDLHLIAFKFMQQHKKWSNRSQCEISA